MFAITRLYAIIALIVKINGRKYVYVPVCTYVRQNKAPERTA